MQTFKLIVIAALSLASAAEAAGPFASPLPGVWSRQGQYLWPGPTAVADFPQDGRNLTVQSPDGRITLQIVNSELSVSGPTPFSRANLEIESLSELLWAPNSNAFAVTAGDGGWVGTWSIRLYLTKDGTITDPSELALQNFAREFAKCPEHPNVGAVGWADGSKHLRLLVEVPCHSSCVDMCRIRGYEVDAATGRIVASFSEAQVRKTWKSALGVRFGGK